MRPRRRVLTARTHWRYDCTSATQVATYKEVYVGRPSKPLISRERAARAALSIIDSRGLEALSLELVARKLGVKAPSFYYHFSDKAELLAEVARLVLLDVDVAPARPETWLEDLVTLCVETRRSILRHPNAAQLLLQFFPRHLLLRPYDRAIATYPFEPRITLLFIEGIEKMNYGSALFEAAARARKVPPMPDVDPSKYPHLAEAVDTNDLDHEEMFVATLRAYISGFRAKYEKPSKSTATRSATSAKKSVVAKRPVKSRPKALRKVAG